MFIFTASIYRVLLLGCLVFLVFLYRSQLVIVRMRLALLWRLRRGGEGRGGHNSRANVVDKAWPN